MAYLRKLSFFSVVAGLPSILQAAEPIISTPLIDDGFPFAAAVSVAAAGLLVEIAAIAAKTQ